VEPFVRSGEATTTDWYALAGAKVNTSPPPAAAMWNRVPAGWGVVKVISTEFTVEEVLGACAIPALPAATRSPPVILNVP